MDVPATPEALLEAWTEAVLARQPEGPWRLVAICAGGPLGFALATCLSRRGTVRLILHDAQLPTRTSRLRRLLRRLREPWGDDLLVRLRHHLRELRSRSLGAALSYFQARTRSAVTGLQRMATPTIKRMMEHQNAYLRLAQTCRLKPWPGETLLIVTPARRAQNLPSRWREFSSRLAVRETGEDAEQESAVAIREFFA
jgi:thioesterase domain-containing protein